MSRLSDAIKASSSVHSQMDKDLLIVRDELEVLRDHVLDLINAIEEDVRRNEHNQDAIPEHGD